MDQTANIDTTRHEYSGYGATRAGTEPPVVWNVDQLPTVYVQGVGYHVARPASDIVVGDCITFTYGTRVKVLRVVAQGEHHVQFMMEGAQGQELPTRSYRLATLVACWREGDPT